jgi:hypothetical protein
MTTELGMHRPCRQWDFSGYSVIAISLALAVEASTVTPGTAALAFSAAQHRMPMSKPTELDSREDEKRGKRTALGVTLAQRRIARDARILLGIRD